MIRKVICAAACMLMWLSMYARNYTIKNDVVIFSDSVTVSNPSYDAMKDFFIHENLYRNITLIHDSENHIAGVTIHNYLPWYEYAQYSRVVIDVTITDKQYVIKIMAAKRYCQQNTHRADGYISFLNMSDVEPVGKKSPDDASVVGYEIFEAFGKLGAEIIGHFKQSILS